MSAGETGGGDVDCIGHEIWPGTVEDVLQQGTDQETTHTCSGHEQSHVLLSVQGQKHTHPDGEHAQHRDASQGSDVTRGLLDEARPAWGPIGVPHRKKDRPVKLLCAAVFYL